MRKATAAYIEYMRVRYGQVASEGEGEKVMETLRICAGMDEEDESRDDDIAAHLKAVTDTYRSKSAGMKP